MLDRESFVVFTAEFTGYRLGTGRTNLDWDCTGGSTEECKPAVSQPTVVHNRTSSEFLLCTNQQPPPSDSVRSTDISLHFVSLFYF